jgi:hypothetical protein
MTEAPDAANFEQILTHLRDTREFDFTSYKRTSLMRRVLRRMQSVNITTFEEYLDYLQVHNDEFAVLFNTILINVTSFFRDPDVWEYLRADALPRTGGAVTRRPLPRMDGRLRVGRRGLQHSDVACRSHGTRCGPAAGEDLCDRPA